MTIDHGTQFGLLAFIAPGTLLRLARRIPSIAPARALRLLGIAAASTAVPPLAAIEALVNGRALRQQAVHPEPVFIIGHWRSGTTHLHNLMSQDSQFGQLQMYEAVAPHCARSARGWLEPTLARVMAAKRPMDNMPWPMDAPQEEEIPLAKMTPYSWYLQFLFPRQAVSTFKRYVLLDGAPESARREVAEKMQLLMRIASQHQPGQRLLLKNPVNTARIPLLLEQFPNARFVFLHRSPYAVLPSTLNLHRKILQLTSLQRYDEALIENNVFELYPALLNRYLRDRALLRPEQLIEVGFDALEQAPMATMARIYRQLQLPGFDTAQPALERYIASLQGYRKNDFPALCPKNLERLESQWSVGFENWGYRPARTASAVRG